MDLTRKACGPRVTWHGIPDQFWMITVSKPFGVQCVIMKTRITDLFGCRYPIVQAGMIWVSGARLAAACSNAGALGLIGGGSMRPDCFEAHVQSMSGRTQAPWGVNIPIFYKYAEQLVEIAIAQGVRIVFTSAGSPKRFTPLLKSHGITVVHVVGNPTQARKCEEAGCDAVVAEGFEAGGHNSPDELTTMVLTRLVRQAVAIPVIAAGGIADGQALAAAFALGADGVQIGSRFAITQESSAHPSFKEFVMQHSSGATTLTLKRIGPVRLLESPFAAEALAAEARGASQDELRALLGQGRARQGIFEGNLVEGELEIGQVAPLLKHSPTAQTVINDLLGQYQSAKVSLP
jgi:enoyl-[acyl-carrier protein] reductase II